MPHDHCPPSRRGHSWRPLRLNDLPHRSNDLPNGSNDLPHRSDNLPNGSSTKIDLALRICRHCGARGLVSNQGVIHLMEAT